MIRSIRITIWFLAILLSCGCGMNTADTDRTQQGQVIDPATPPAVWVDDRAGTPGSNPSVATPVASNADTSPSPPPSAWHTYDDPQFGFSIKYPDSYTVRDNATTPDAGSAGRVHLVNFIDTTFAKSDTAALQLPLFTVEVFTRPTGTSLETWLDTYGGKGTRTPVTVGKEAGYRVTSASLQAPNQFYYTTSDTYIYRLTPLGPYSSDVLASFTFQ